MYKKEGNDVSVVKSPTGSGKTHALILNALYETFCFKKTSIISTKNKKLVDQIHSDCEYLYQNQTIRGIKISKKKIFIVKHTKEEHLAKELLLDLFCKGEGIIITVHNYLRAFDDFYNVSFLNALSYMFPSLVNIFYDEADYYIDNMKCSYFLMTALTKDNDTLSFNKKFYFNQNWSETNKIEDAIKVINFSYYKNTRKENVSIIKENLSFLDKNENLIFIENFDNNNNIIIKLSNIFKEGYFDKIELSSEDIKFQSSTETKFYLNLNKELKATYKEAKKNILIYNYLSTILNTIINATDPRKAEESNSKFKRIISSTNVNREEELESFFIQLEMHIKMYYFDKYLLLNNSEKELFLENFNIYFEIYKKMAISERRLFNIISITNGNECLLRSIYTSEQPYLTIYYSRALACKIRLNNKIGNNDDYSFTVLKTEEILINSSKELYEKKINTDQLKNLVKSLRSKFLNKKNNNLSVDKEEDGGDNFSNEQIQIKNIKKSFENLNNATINMLSKNDKNVISNEIKEFFENNIPLKGESKKSIQLDIILKIESPNELAPFGAKIDMYKDLDISKRLSAGKRILSSANYERNNLKMFSKFNKIFSQENSLTINEKYKEKIKSDRPIDTLYILCNNFEFTSHQKKLDYIKKYWKTFSKLFYEQFYEDKTLKEQKIGMIGLPSQKKVDEFYKSMGFNNYVCYISGNDQNTPIEINSFNDFNYTKNFNPNQKVKESSSIVVTSVFSTASIGLNMPHLFYLNVSLNNFKPRHTYYDIGVKINEKLVNPEYQIIQESLIQIIGRMTRFDKYSKTQVRILEIYKNPPLDNMLFFPVFITNLLKVFNNINLISIEKQEEIFVSLIYSKKFIIYFNKYQKEILKNYIDPINLQVCSDYFAEFKINLINLLKNNHQDGDFDILFKGCVEKYYKKIINIIYMGIIGQMYVFFCENTIKTNKKVTFSKFKDSMKLSRKAIFNDLYNYLEHFFKEFENSNVNKENFLEVYNLYKKEINFSLNDFIKNQVKNTKFDVIQKY